MHRQIVDEHRRAGAVALDDRPRRHALAAAGCRRLRGGCRGRRAGRPASGCASSPRLVRMTMSATSPIRPSASSAPGTSVWRCISPRKKASSSGQTWSSGDRLARVDDRSSPRRNWPVSKAKWMPCASSSQSAKWATMCSSTSSQSVISSGPLHRFQLRPRGDQLLRLDADRLRDGDQVRLMRFEETAAAPPARPARPARCRKSSGSMPVRARNRCARRSSVKRRGKRGRARASRRHLSSGARMA